MRESRTSTSTSAPSQGRGQVGILLPLTYINITWGLGAPVHRTCALYSILVKGKQGCTHHTLPAMMACGYGLSDSLPSQSILSHNPQSHRCKIWQKFTPADLFHLLSHHCTLSLASQYMCMHVRMRVCIYIDICVYIC